ncbi:MAG: hypothetical protein ACRED4_01180 [Brevundimonas sp.]
MQNEQTPAAGPLTAESARLLVKGDWLLCHESEERFEPKITAGTLAQFIRPSGSGGVSNCIVTSFHPSFGFRPSRFTFLGRPDQDGWIAWRGGENPVPGVMVEIIMRAEEGMGLHEPAASSNGYRWNHLKASDFDGNGDIIAYRPHVASPASSSSVVQGDANGVEREGDYKDILAYAQGLATTAAKKVGCVDDWRPLSDISGCLTQIDNALTGLVALTPTAAPVSRPLATGAQHSTATDFPDDEVLACVGSSASPVSRPAGEGEREAVARLEEMACDLRSHMAAGIGDFVIRSAWVSEAEADLRTVLALLSPAAPDAGGGGVVSHMNISDPNSNSGVWREMLEVGKLKAEIDVLRRERDHYQSNLESIFDRIKSGEEVYLQYGSGERIWIIAKPEDHPKERDHD